MPTPSPDWSDLLLVELDGPGVTPETVDAVEFLEFAASFLQLVQANADESGTELTLTDVKIIRKCAAVATRPSSLEIARENAELAQRQVSGLLKTPRRFNGYAKRVRSSLKKLPAGTSARVEVAKWSAAVSQPSTSARVMLTEPVTMYATLTRIGGRPPKARFSAAGETAFLLNISRALATRLSAQLYREVELQADVVRDSNEAIVDGTVLDFAPLIDGDPTDAWRAWFKKVGGDEWASVVDIEAELGRKS